MPGISDMIERFIMAMLAESQQVELQRNQLAIKFDCAPSQINYVLSTRFTLQKGYVIESKRGGGGYVRVIRIADDTETLLYDLITGDVLEGGISQEDADAVIERLHRADALSRGQRLVMHAAVSDTALEDVPPKHKDIVRARILSALAQAIACSEAE